MRNILVSKEWLYSTLHSRDIVIADCRFNLGNPSAGKVEYENGHIPGAVYFHLNDDLSGPADDPGKGRHPLPDPAVFAEKMARSGIGNDTTVVAYDDQGGSMAARLWWLLTYTGNSNARVLDESFSKWLDKGYPVDTKVPEIHEKAHYKVNINPHMTASAEEVKRAGVSGAQQLIDARSPERFKGEYEPIDPVAGHIPGAVNDNWENRLDSEGRWKSAAELKNDLKQYERSGSIVYCGSGVTACANILAFTAAGKSAKLFPESWSGWIADNDNPVNKG
ncbi:sulfurtransferase [Alteribacter natronophilus]|uniref:sulfurtransferase n=1 Tax=Alteribacter natronophilus TaxID=2583810 RepID=UPI00110DAF55|nr:sulfurtransferase [Alteribacter natronophilus]TMW73414.1 sulfurtransferase [Alteribacter natronophilus]